MCVEWQQWLAVLLRSTNTDRFQVRDIVLLWIIVIITSFDNHYYDEDDIEVGKAVSCQVAVNHVVELTEEEKAEARQEAIKQYQREELAKIQSRNARVKKTENATTQVQPSLFDF